MTSFLLALGYTPLLDPIPIDRYWLWFIIPLILAVSITYKATKIPDKQLHKLPKQAMALACQILGFMALASAILLGLTEIIGL